MKLESKQIIPDREVHVKKYVNLYRDRDRSITKYSVEVRMKQIVYGNVNNNRIILDEYEVHEERRPDKIDLDSFNKIIDELESQLRNILDQRYEEIVKIIEISKSLDLVIWVED